MSPNDDFNGEWSAGDFHRAILQARLCIVQGNAAEALAVVQSLRAKNLGNSEQALSRKRFLTRVASRLHSGRLGAENAQLQVASERNINDETIVVFGHTRQESLRNILDSLSRQGAMKHVEVWLDGAQGNWEKQKKVEAVAEMARAFAPRALHVNKGNFGFRKMILTTLREVSKRSRDIIVLEDDCFPTASFCKEFRSSLDEIRDSDEVFSVYGHHFGIEEAGQPITRFQGWGWATTADKLAPILRELFVLYSMTAQQYTDYISAVVDDELRQRLDITPPRLPSMTYDHFFAWDEALTVLTGIFGLTHKPTEKRVVYNCGLNDGGAHFDDKPIFREPPFNMIKPNEVWDHFEDTDAPRL